MPAKRIAKRKKFGDDLNKEQYEAATYGEKTGDGFISSPLLVIAGAGTGKTTMLTNRVAYLQLQGVPAERILLLTFTRRAAVEMCRRAEAITAKALRRHASSATLPWAGTFHAVGSRLLREHAASLGISPDFQILDRGDAADLMDQIRHELGYGRKKKPFPLKTLCLAIYSSTVNTGMTLEETVMSICLEHIDKLKALNRLFQSYVEAKQQQELLDYDDLLLYWRELLRDDVLAAEVGGRFDHVLIDEYQDTNVLQGEIISALKPDGQGVCVVGDDDQSIYAFRGATVENIRAFPDQYDPPAKVITLDQNYRSGQPILDTANRLIGEGSRRFKKRLYSAYPSEQKPRYVMVEDDRSQARYVVDRVIAAREEGVTLQQQAVLMRNSHDSAILEAELTTHSIPYVKYGGVKYLEAAHIKDVLALLRFAANPHHRLAGLRVLKLLPGIGSGHASRALDLLESRGFELDALISFTPPAAAAVEWRKLVKLVLALHGTQEWTGQLTKVLRWYEPHLPRLYDSEHTRMADLEQLEALSAQYESRERFLTELTLDPPQSSKGDVRAAPPTDDDFLTLSTVHSAKSLEWEAVYVLCMRDGTFPSSYAAGDAEAIEEERRVLYVALTRAKRDLHVIEPLKVFQRGQRDDHAYGARSRFMTPPVMETFEVTPYGDPRKRKRPRKATRKRIDAKSRIRSMWD
ncbi:MAG: ATP-dependent helicase [Pseudomonadales bacterium]